jgi:hypothetical protein
MTYLDKVVVQGEDEMYALLKRNRIAESAKQLEQHG